MCLPWEDLKQFCVGGKDNEIMAWASLILSIDMILYIYVYIYILTLYVYIYVYVYV